MEQLLTKFRLSGPEITVYKMLLKLGGAKVSVLAKATGLKRTSCQEYVRSLEEKGFINYSKIGNKYFYQIEDPDTFRQIINEREFVVDRLISRLQSSAPFNNWSVRATSVEEVNKKIRRAQRKNQVVDLFGNKEAGGALLNAAGVLLWSPGQEVPAIEIRSEAIARLHKQIFKI